MALILTGLSYENLAATGITVNASHTVSGINYAEMAKSVEALRNKYEKIKLLSFATNRVEM